MLWHMFHIVQVFYTLLLTNCFLIIYLFPSGVLIAENLLPTFISSITTSMYLLFGLLPDLSLWWGFGYNPCFFFSIWSPEDTGDSHFCPSWSPILVVLLNFRHLKFYFSLWKSMPSLSPSFTNSHPVSTMKVGHTDDGCCLSGPKTDLGWKFCSWVTCLIWLLGVIPFLTLLSAFTQNGNLMLVLMLLDFCPKALGWEHKTIGLWSQCFCFLVLKHWDQNTKASD